MNDRRIRDALRRAAASGGEDDARERSRRVVLAAHSGHEPRRPRRRWPALLVALALLPVAAGGVAAASAPDSGVGRWVREVLGVDAKHARPVLGRVPGGGTLLVQAGGSGWVVAANGAKRRLGVYAGTSWSPRGLYVAGWRGRELTALDPSGRVRWSLAAPATISAARWGAVDGFRVAYVAGATLRVVNGDGSGDRRYARAQRVAPAWRPDNAHVLAYVGADRRVRVAAVDARRTLWRSGRLDAPSALAWSSSGKRLLVVTRRRLVLFDGSGQRLRSRAVPAGLRVTGVAWRPRGTQIAIVRRDASAGRSELLLAEADDGWRERVLFTGPGSFGTPAWSPGATRLLLPWPDADQWLFLRPGSRAGLAAVANVARQFAPGANHGTFPRSVQWCCAAPPPATP